jgi:hypothetical protein
VKRFAILLFAATAAFGQTLPERVALDAAVVDRVAEASKRDLPRDLLRRIIEEDLELLRGRRTDGSYQYATWERFESGRVTRELSVNPGEKPETLEARGANVYRVLIEAPSRRLLVRKNRAVWVERVDAEYMAEGSAQLQQRAFDVKSWLQPGESRAIELPDIARQVTVRVIARVEAGGYGNLTLALVQARIVDLASSPYAGAVTSAKALLRVLESGEVNEVRANAVKLRDALGARTVSNVPDIAVIAQPSARAPEDATTRSELRTELQMIEDLLTGTEAERREGLDRLHQLIRRMR